MIVSDNLYNQKIKVTNIEEKIILSKPFQRLKYIHQKGFSYKISPIKHSRYEHSLGVFTLSYLFNLNQSHRLAALLHDVGHAPFSHSLKIIFKDNHRQRSKHYLDILEGKLKILSKQEVNVIYSLINGVKENPLRPLNRQSLSLDMLDNIIRDSFYAGFLNFNFVDIFKKIKYNNYTIIIEQSFYMKLKKLLIRLNEEIYYNQKILSYENNFLGKAFTAYLLGVLKPSKHVWDIDKNIYKLINKLEPISLDQPRRLYFLK